MYLGVHAVHAVWKDPGERVPRLSALRDLHGLPVPPQGLPGPERIRRQGHLQRVHTGPRMMLLHNVKQHDDVNVT